MHRTRRFPGGGLFPGGPLGCCLSRLGEISRRARKWGAGHSESTDPSRPGSPGGGAHAKTPTSGRACLAGGLNGGLCLVGPPARGPSWLRCPDRETSARSDPALEHSLQPCPTGSLDVLPASCRARSVAAEAGNVVGSSAHFERLEEDQTEILELRDARAGLRTSVRILRSTPAQQEST